MQEEKSDLLFLQYVDEQDERHIWRQFMEMLHLRESIQHWEKTNYDCYMQWKEFLGDPGLKAHAAKRMAERSCLQDLPISRVPKIINYDNSNQWNYKAWQIAYWLADMLPRLDAALVLQVSVLANMCPKPKVMRVLVHDVFPARFRSLFHEQEPTKRVKKEPHIPKTIPCIKKLQKRRRKKPPMIIPKKQACPVVTHICFSCAGNRSSYWRRLQNAEWFCNACALRLANYDLRCSKCPFVPYLHNSECIKCNAPILHQKYFDEIKKS